jgi:ATP-binding cassette subfamily B protein
MQLSIGLVASSLLQLIFPSTKYCRCRDSKIRTSIFYLFNPVCAIVSIYWKNVRTHPSWLLLHLSTRINISWFRIFYQINEFADLLLMSGWLAILCNALDHRIENIDYFFLKRIVSGKSICLLWEAFLAYYNLQIFLCFFFCAFFYFWWITHAFKRRKELDYKRFHR